MILFFDTETTGLSPGRIIQLSYVMQSSKNVKTKNFFFYVDYVEPSAVAVHGFTPEKLFVLSNGHTFSTDIEEIYDVFLRADVIIAHNLSFDLKFMIAEFAYHDRQFRYREGICSMRYFTDIIKIPRENGKGYKYPKLTEFSKYYDLYPYDVTMETAKLFGLYGQSHDARYDTAELYLEFNRAAKYRLFGIGYFVKPFASHLRKPHFERLRFRRRNRRHKPQNAFRIKTIGFTHFTVGSLHFQPVTICHDFASFVF